MLIAEYGYFLSHRLALAQAAVAAGYEVTVITGIPPGVTPGTWTGVRVVPLELPRGMGNPIADLCALWRLVRWLRVLRPAILQNVSVKMVFLGTLAAWLAGVPCVLNAYTGLGTLFHAASLRMRATRAIIVPVLAWFVCRTRAWSLFQNADDQARMLELDLAAPDRCALVCGTGVDTGLFQPAPEPDGAPVVLFVGRLLEDKGIREFVSAATTLQGQGVAGRFLAAGEPDPANPRSISPALLDEWRRAGAVEWPGHVADMPGLMSRSHIICMPSYHEGVPKVLLEAAASGRPAVATDIAGCRSVVRDQVTGLLVPPRDAAALAGALARLIANPELRRAFGASARAIAETTFAAPIINRQIVDVYRRMGQT